MKLPDRMAVERFITKRRWLFVLLLLGRKIASAATAFIGQLISPFYGTVAGPAAETAAASEGLGIVAGCTGVLAAVAVLIAIVVGLYIAVFHAFNAPKPRTSAVTNTVQVQNSDAGATQGGALGPPTEAGRGSTPHIDVQQQANSSTSRLDPASANVHPRTYAAGDQQPAAAPLDEAGMQAQRLRAITAGNIAEYNRLIQRHRALYAKRGLDPCASGFFPEGCTASPESIDTWRASGESENNPNVPPGARENSASTPARGLPPEGVFPPVAGSEPFKKGPASRPSERARGGESLWDPAGGEWRWFPGDRWHNPHWDYNPHNSPNSPWENVPHGGMPPVKPKP